MSDEANNPAPELAFESTDAAPEPVEVEDKQVVDEVSDTEVDAVEAAAGEDGEEEQEAAPESVTVEYDGTEYELPPELKDAFLRHGDYTRKSQELSSQRKAMEEQQAQLEQHAAFQKETFEDAAVVKALGQQIEQYNALNWGELYTQDAAQAGLLNHQKQELEGQRQQTINRLEARRKQFEGQQVEAHAKAIEQGQSVLKKEIEGWSPELGQTIADYGISQGLSAQAVGNISDPVHVKIIDKARRYDELVAKQKAKPKAQADQPKAAVKVKGKRASAAKDPDKMSMDEWLSHRNKQIAARAGARA